MVDWLKRDARGEDCALMLYPHCCGDPSRTVLAHAPSPDNGMGLRQAPDWWAIHACDKCHDIIDGRNRNHDISPLELATLLNRAIYRTQKRLIESGRIVVVDGPL